MPLVGQPSRRLRRRRLVLWHGLAVALLAFVLAWSQVLALAGESAGTAHGSATARLADARQLAQSVPAAEASQTAQARTGGLFGSVEFRGERLEAFPQWRRVMREMEEAEEILARCDAEADCPSPRVAAWRAKIASLRGRHPLAQLDEINRFINELMPYREDIEVYGVSDYWAAPLEFLRRSGDCEDFAIIKFYSLLELGFDNDQMRIVVLNDTLRQIAHAVLAVRIDDREYILDNNFSVVLTDDRLPQYVPQYSLNLTTRWLHIATDGLGRSGG